MRLLGISLISFALFLPSYWVTHYFFGENIGAALALMLTIIAYPYLLSKVWKYYPPIDVVAIEPDDEFHEQCIARARNEIHRLKAGLLEGQKEAFVKFSIRSDGGADHLWGLAHSIINDSVVVTLANEPVHELDDSIHGDPREKVPLTEVQDWMLVDKSGNYEGGYTHLAMLKAYKKEYGKVPKKYLKGFRNFVDIDKSEYA